MALTEKKRIVLIGGTKRAVPTFQSLAARTDIEIIRAIFMSGYEDERKYADELVVLAKKSSIPYYVEESITEEIFIDIEKARPDAMIGIGVWRSLLSNRFLALAKDGLLALHGTALPDYRGWAGINWQIINGEKEQRMRAYRIAEGIDNGPLICSPDGKPIEYHIDLDNEKHLSEIFEEYEAIHVHAINEIVNMIVTGNLTVAPQDERLATYSCHRGPEDGEINWSEDTKKVFNFIRAQSRPYNGAFTYYKGKKVLLWRVRPRPEYKNFIGRIPGKVVTRDIKTGNAVILTGDGGIEVIDASIPEDMGTAQPPIKIFTSVRDRCKSRTETYLDTIGFK